MRFDFAIESQRHKELLANNYTLHSMLKWKLHMDIKSQGRESYTHKKIYIFQSKLWSPFVDYGAEETKEKGGKLLLCILDNTIVNVIKVSKLR